MLDQVIDRFTRRESEAVQVGLLQALAHPEQGGRGYGLDTFNPWFDRDGWEVDHAGRMIRLDTEGFFTTYGPDDMAGALADAVRTEFLRTATRPWAEIAWGAGKVMLGAVQTAVGVVGIIVPEPGTTVAGVVLVGLGANTVGDGVSQLFGANQGEGVNVLSEAFASAGGAVADLADVDREVGRMAGRGVFFVSEIALGGWGALKIMRVPNATLVGRGILKHPGGPGVRIGRVDMAYPSMNAGDGMTIFSINNNAGQSILRFVTHDGRLMMNGRIVGQRNFRHLTAPREIFAALLTLLRHGAKY